MRVAVSILAAGLWLAPVPARADEAVSDVLAVPRIQTPPVIDGVAGDEEWRAASAAVLAYQTQPGDNAAPTERTEVRLAFDRDHLYVAIQAWDSEPAAVRGRVARRDDIFGDDYVTIHLDTHDDRRRAYVFSFNPLGIQGDGLYNEGVSTGRNFDANVDRTWDGVLTSKGRLTDEGYTIEVAIPFKSLRYEAGTGRRWGLHVQRWIARKGESVSWRPISREVPSLLTQMGGLTGLTEIGSGPAIDLIPTVTAAVTGDRQIDGGLANSNDLEPGVTASWAMTPNMSVSGTANPDFSQIEADVPQIEVNQRFPLRYAEKRPFFLEGGQFFRSPGALNFVETRQIVDPDWGAKFTAKSGRNTYAVLAAEDAPPGLATAPEQPGHDETAQVAIGRYQRDILQNSTVGGFVTTRRFAGDDNTVVALDGQFRLPLQTIGYQSALSFTDARGVTSRGDATYVWYDFVGRHWRLFVNDQRISGDYRADTAFVRRTGFKQNTITLGYELQGEKTWWVRARPFIVSRALRLPDGTMDESYVDPGVDVTFARDITLYAYRSFHRNSFLGREYNRQFSSVSTTVNTLKRITVSGRVIAGEDVHYDLVHPQVGRLLDLSFTVTIKPDARLNSEMVYLKSRLREYVTDRVLFNQDLYRNRTNYQFTREHAARSIVEYNTLSRRVSVSLLYTYLPRPNTSIYGGYGDILFSDLDPVTRTRLDGLNRQRRTVFLKLSHNFRR